MEAMAEILDGLFPMALALDDHGNLQPEQIALGVIIRAALPVAKASVASEHAGYRVSSILQRAPRAAGTSGPKLGGNGSKIVTVLLRSPKAAARRKQRTQKISETFVNPQQIGLHGRLEIRSAQIGRAAKLSIPGVDEFVGEQAAHASLPGRRQQGAF